MAMALYAHFLLITAIVTIGYQLPFFLIAAYFKFDKVIDFAGSTNFVILAIMTLLLKGTWHFRQIVLTMFVLIWGLRLGTFLLLRILQWGEDRRFDKIRDNPTSLAGLWTLQCIWIWTVSLPVTIVNASERDPSLKPQDIIGWIMWLVGITIEAIADQQKLKFKKSTSNKGKWCNIGAWKYSRHPNYFGEILLWWGIFIASIPVLEGGEWLVIVSPIFTTLLLSLVTGISILEASADKRFSAVKEYKVYKSTTSPLVPLPPAIYGSLPSWFRVTFLFEFPLYSRGLHNQA
ncbi:hypothetical protein M5K25_012390 [Dendrobium thyrsiflorum]|uniref:Steroid 5-alpha reductase C-terminal domain-containing protein n=1 Tax=Dendrobium thyrsiflorum TaxID=117978 RepID=A0ABD0UX16_DENTH